ncbi:MAG TPA: hypothetical protein DEQ30_09410 [Porphyromonadaceae bacterium]|nr:hypothetical protein [Porphyromonadaceae bacterium]
MNTNNKLDELKDRNPFRVPDGYFESFTENMMSRLPEKTVEEPNVISIYDRVKPWLYMAAAFAGLVLLFNVLNKTAGTSAENEDTRAVTIVTVSPSGVESEADENVEFLEYIEDMYVDKYALSYIDDFMNN